VNERFAFDVARAGRATLAGADEAGRGCLAGPLVAAAVCFDYAALDDADFDALEALNDSKRLTPARRAVLYAEVLRRARQVVVVCCSPGTIDRDGLHRCNLGSLARALAGVSPAAAHSLVDGFRLPACPVSHEAIVGGDGRSAAIAAASVVAKVTRDRVMHRLHATYPEYGFDRHVGYATQAHQEAIVAHGVCELHRLSFASVAYQQLGMDLAEEPPST
jgi:ribonuclease HII